MPVDIVTQEDLERFRFRLINDFKQLLQSVIPLQNELEKGYKTADAREILGCCKNKLTSLRISRKLRTKKIGGTVYYNKDDIKRLLEEGF